MVIIYNAVFNLLFLLPGIWSLRLTYMEVPSYKKKGENVTLLCDYDLEGDPLYSIKWYKDMKEFIRYDPESTQMTMYNVNGVNLDHNISHIEVVYLLDVDRSSTGTYTCEISVDAPSFQTVANSSNLTVLELPNKGPKITGGRSSYAIGEKLHVICTSPKSWPAADLHWYLNAKPVNESWLVNRDYIEGEDNLISSVLELQFTVQKRHFSGGSLQLECTATIHPQYTQSHVRKFGGGQPLSADLVGSGSSNFASFASLILLQMLFLLRIA